MRAVKNAIRNVFRLGDKYITFALISLVGAFCVVAALMLIDSTDDLGKLNEMPYDGYYRAIPTYPDTEFIAEDFQSSFLDTESFFLTLKAVVDTRVSNVYRNKAFDILPMKPSTDTSSDETGTCFTVREVPKSEYDGAFRRGERLLVEGRHLTAEDQDKYLMLIDEKLAELNGLTVGCVVNMVLDQSVKNCYYNEDFDIVIIEDELIPYEIVGIFKTTIAQPEAKSAQDMNGNLVYVSKCASIRGFIESASYDYYIKLAPGVDAEAFFDYFYTFNYNFRGKTFGYEFVAVDELNAEYNSSANTLLSISTVMLGVLIVTVTCASLAFCRVLVSSRRREILIMRALGARNSRIVGQLLIELVIVLIPFAVIGASTAALTLNPVVRKCTKHIQCVS